MEQSAQLRFAPLTEEQARAIAAWRYPPPYDFYNAADPQDLRDYLDPANSYLGATDDRGALLGFFCFGGSARIPEGEACGAYADPQALDIGLGLRPDLTGRGLGGAFLQAGLEEGRARFAPRAFRLTVAAFNRRAIAVYARAGFRPTHTFTGAFGAGSVAWICMVRPEAVE